MRRRLFCFALFALGFLALASHAMAAYQLTFGYVQYRVKEDGTQLNRLYFTMKDAEGNFVTEDKLKSIKLINPKGKQVKIQRPAFNKEFGLSSWYNGEAGQWIHDGVIHEETGYYVDFKARLIPGAYKLIVTYDGFKYKGTYNFNKRIKLPIISSSSFSLEEDKQGNLFCKWTVPDEMFYLSDKQPTLQTSTRASINVYDGDTYIGYLSLKVPTHMGEAFIPKRIMDMLKEAGTRAKFVVQIRTNDNNNRSYSNQVDLNF